MSIFGHRRNHVYSRPDCLNNSSATQSDHRTIEDVLLPNGPNLTRQFAEQSRSWWYRKYATGNTTLESLEIEARDGQRGLWADPHACRRGRGESFKRPDMSTLRPLTLALPLPLHRPKEYSTIY